MTILFGMPIAQVLLFGFVITNEIKDAKIGIYDKANDEISRQMTSKLLSSGYFKLEKIIRSESQIEELFRQGQIKLVIVFGENLGQTIRKENTANIQIITDATDPNTASMLANYASSIILDFSRDINRNAQLPMAIQQEVRMNYNPELKSVYMFVPGIIASLLMLISAMMTSISIAREKEMGTMEILLASPLKAPQIIIGKVLPYVIIATVNFISVLLLGKYVFGLPVHGSDLFLFSESLLFIVMSLSMGILISTVSKTQQIAMMLSMFALMMPTILLSGFIFPIENMPFLLQIISYIIPARWFIVIVKSIMLKGAGIEYVWKETLVIAAMTLFFIALSIKKFKTRLE